MSDKLYDISGHDAQVAEDCSYILFRGEKYVRPAEVAAHLEELADKAGAEAAKWFSQGERGDYEEANRQEYWTRAAAESVRELGERP